MTLQLVQSQGEMVKAPDLSSVLLAQEEFHGAFEVPRNNATKELYVNLVDEEHEEWVEEYYKAHNTEADELKELTDLLYVTAGLMYQHDYKLVQPKEFNMRKHYDEDITDIVFDIVVDDFNEAVLNKLVYSIFGYAAYMGWDLIKAYARVHESNMSKLGTDGKPVRRSDGKVLKGPNYKPPILTDLTYETTTS